MSLHTGGGYDLMPQRRRWLLIYPPLVHSNWGEYYPSTAVLAAVLERCGVRCSQIDLNAELLHWLADPLRLQATERRLARNNGDEAAIHRAAVALSLEHRSLLFDESDRLKSSASGYGREVGLELSRPLHLDRTVTDMMSLAFARGPEASVYHDFFDASSLRDHLQDPDCAVVGLSVPMGPQIGPAVLLARWIKSVRPDVRVLAGGPSFTLMAPDDLAQFSPTASGLDTIVRYEGEKAVAALASQVGTSKACSPEASEFKQAPRVRDLPFPLYDRTLMARLHSPRVSVLQARGCYWGKCAYCDFIELYSSDRAYDGRAVDEVLREVEWQQAKHGVSAFWLVTEALPPRVAHRFAKAVINSRVKIDWRSFAMVDPSFDSETLGLLKESGCTSLTIGLETMTSRVLKLVRKKADWSMNIAFLNELKKSGLRVDLNLIPDLPTATYAEALDSLEALRSYTECFRTVSVFPFEATRSSDIGRRPVHFGLTPDETAVDPLHPKGQAQFASNRLATLDHAMSPEERAEVFARYRAFARGHGVASGPVVALPGERVLLYDWGRDQLWRLPAHRGRFNVHEAAEQVWQTRAFRLDQIPSIAAAVRTAAERGWPKCAI